MKKIADLLIRHKAIEFGDFTLASGAKSRYDVDVKTAVTHPDFLAEIAREIAERYDFDVVAGVAVGGYRWPSRLRLPHKSPSQSYGRRRKIMARRHRLSGM